jgi:hypothetical protein
VAKFKEKNPGSVEVRMRLPAELAEELQKRIDQQGVDKNTFLRVALRGALQARPKTYGMDDKLTFGRFAGETLGDVLRVDGGYVKWCLDNLPTFSLDDEARQLYEELYT